MAFGTKFCIYARTLTAFQKNTMSVLAWKRRGASEAMEVACIVGDLYN